MQSIVDIDPVAPGSQNRLSPFFQHHLGGSKQQWYG